ncbi:MAG: PH domain-containing protein [Gammaproteobacteria bacterium]|nr:MAG: PH domain-containing protein [Gammaproteobacteria bacterium]
MSYINKTLLPDEKVIYSSHPHWIVFFRSWAILIVIAAFLLIGARPTLLIIGFFSLLALIVCLSGLIVYYSSEFGITDKRVVMKSGFISRVAFENSLDRIEGVEISQSILGRILDYGSIRIRGVSGTNELFSAVCHPFRFRYKVLEEIERQKKAK